MTSDETAIGDDVLAAVARPEVPSSPSSIEEVRESVQQRVLWLATAMIHWANRVRPNVGGLKVGGHQASSASSVAILSALFFETLTASDRIAIKPHASPAFHAIQFLLGNLSQDHMESLRSFGGLQAYPSRTKDPDPVDYSTGSVGLGGTAAAFGALVRDYLTIHDLNPSSARFFAHMGDAELDEGSIWETAAEPLLAEVEGCIWVIDLNRQSLDRVIPGVRVAQMRDMFRANGWDVIDAKYGRELDALFERSGGEILRTRLDEMSNEEYQAIITSQPGETQGRLIRGLSPRSEEAILECLSGVPDETLASTLARLAGHDVAALVGCLEEASRSRRPTVVLAYTIKGWGLPFAGDPLNHSALLSDKQMQILAEELGCNMEDPWQRFPLDTLESGYVEAAVQRLRRTPELKADLPDMGAIDLHVTPRSSTQEAFGRYLTELDRHAPLEVKQRLVTVSPDVATSTNMGSWVNRVGVWSRDNRPNYLEGESRPLHWTESKGGRHLELGLSETNLFLLLGQLGLAEELSGQRLIPIGTVYDVFLTRGLGPLIYGLYQQSRFIVAGTPSGVSLAAEGGAHQSVITPSILLELPGLSYFEPTFGKELGWIMDEAIQHVASGEPGSYFIRLSTRPIDQTMLPVPEDPIELSTLKRRVIDGCYRLRRASQAFSERVHIFAVGAIVPEALAAIPLLEEEGISPNIFAVTSPGRLFKRSLAAARSEIENARHIHDPFQLLGPDETTTPVVTAMDGHPHTMSFIGSALNCPSSNLGVERFGESGTIGDLYNVMRIDAEAIASASIGLLSRARGQK